MSDIHSCGTHPVLAKRVLHNASERTQGSRDIARECGAAVHSRYSVLDGQSMMTTCICESQPLAGKDRFPGVQSLSGGIYIHRSHVQGCRKGRTVSCQSRTKCWQSTCANMQQIYQARKQMEPDVWKQSSRTGRRHQETSSLQQLLGALEANENMNPAKERLEVMKDETRMKRRLETELRKPITKWELKSHHCKSHK